MRFIAKYNPNFIALAFAFCAVIASLSGCTKAAVDEVTTARVSLSIDWSEVKSAEEVHTASIYLYPEEGGQPVVLTGVATQAAEIDVPSGTYRVIIHNENLAQIQMRNTGSYSAFEAFIPVEQRVGGPSEESAKTKIPTIEYLHLITGTANREMAITGGQPVSFTLRPKTATATYNMFVKVPTRLDFVGVNAVLSGVATRMNLFEAKPLATDLSSVDIATTVTYNQVKDTLTATGKIESFGVAQSDRNPWTNTLFLDLTPKNGAVEGLKTQYQVDLTSFFDKYNSRNLNITVSLVSPDPEQPDAIECVVTVVPWIVEEGGTIEVDPTE